MKKTAKKLLICTLITFLAIFVLASCDILLSRCPHSWSKATCKDPSKCLICGEVNGAPIEHAYFPEVTKPTCTTDGYTTYTCAFCNDSYTSDAVKADGHIESDWITDKEATETEDGKRHTECTVCHEIIKPYEVVEAHKHTYVSVIVEPTCTEDGYVKHACRCEYYYVDTFTPALGHIYSNSYTSDGNGRHTSVCTRDSSHILTDVCSGGTLPTAESAGICGFCGGEYLYYASEGNSSYGFLSFADEYSDGYKYQELYVDLWSVAEAFADSTSNLPMEDGYYTIGSADFSVYGLTAEQAKSVWKIFYIDNPAYYWLCNTVVTTEEEIFLVIDESYANAAYRAQCDRDIAEMVTECSEYIDEGMNELERAVAIVKYIVSNMEYAYESDGKTPVDDIWAHNLIGLAQKGYGVCETYAKSFMYFCSIYGVDCIMGSGNAGGEAHAWNYIAIDGIWYGVDVTWTDNSGDKAFYDKFGMSDSFTHSDHELFGQGGFGLDYNYDIPEISDTTMQLAALYKDGAYQGIYMSIDDALASIIDPDAEYEIKIDFYSNYLGHEDYVLNASELPSAKKIAITGLNVPAPEGYVDYNTPITIVADALKLNSTLSIENIELVGTGANVIELGKNELIFNGKSANAEIGIEAPDPLAKVTVNIADRIDFKKSVNIYSLNINSGTIVLHETSYIKNENGNVFRINENVEIIGDVRK